MRADGDAMRFFAAEMAASIGVGIAGVKTGCDIRRADQLEQLGVVPGAFA